MAEWAMGPLRPFERVILRAMLYAQLAGMAIGLPLMIFGMIAGR